MDPNHVVLEISSDEEGGWNDNLNREVIDGIDDDDGHNWIADILNEVNRNDCGFDNDDDSDEVVVVSEVLASKKKKNLSVKSSSLFDFDDECMVLDHDPDKPFKSRDDGTNNRDKVDDDDDGDEDDVVVVSEKGQVACRDYPHSRHLCIKFPFSSTPNQSHCDQCYCYVCDSLAPCVYWGDGSACLDHCQATDKYDFWKLARQNSKNATKVIPIQPISKITDASISIRLPPINLVPPVVHNHVPIPSPAMSSNFGVPNIINQTGSRNKYQSSLVSQQLMRTTSCTLPRERVHHNYSLNAPLQRPVFKRTVSAGVPQPTNRYSYSSYNDNYRNAYSQPSVVNTSLPFHTPNHTFEEPPPRSNPTVDFSPTFQPSLNQETYVDPFLFRPEGQSSLPNYSILSGVSQLVNQGHRSTVNPKKVEDIGWPQSHTTPQRSILEGGGPTGSGELVDSYFNNDNWWLNNQACEPGSVEVPESFGFNEFSPEPGFINEENGRQHW